MSRIVQRSDGLILEMNWLVIEWFLSHIDYVFHFDNTKSLKQCDQTFMSIFHMKRLL